MARGQLLNSQNENSERELDSGNCSNGQLGSAEYDTVASYETPTVNSDSDEELDSLFLQNTLALQQIHIDGFRLEKLIGKGGFARVYQAWDKNLSRSVAVKILEPERVDARGRRRFAREAKTASSVDSPYVINVLSSGETSIGQPFICLLYTSDAADE